MDKSRILTQGTEAKFRIVSEILDLHLIDFVVKIVYGYRRKTIEIDKSEMLLDDAGHYFFTFDTAGMIGRVDVVCEYEQDDNDYPDGSRNVSDVQPLLMVVTNSCPRFACCLKCDGSHPVRYEIMSESNADSYGVLCDCGGSPLMTTETDGMSLRLLVRHSSLDVA